MRTLENKEKKSSNKDAYTICGISLGTILLIILLMAISDKVHIGVYDVSL